MEGRVTPPPTICFVRRLVFKPGFEVGIYTAADLADLGIPTEGIEMVMEDQDAEGRARVGAGGW